MYIQTFCDVVEAVGPDARVDDILITVRVVRLLKNWLSGKVRIKEKKETYCFLPPPGFGIGNVLFLVEQQGTTLQYCPVVCPSVAGPSYPHLET